MTAEEFITALREKLSPLLPGAVIDYSGANRDLWQNPSLDLYGALPETIIVECEMEGKSGRLLQMLSVDMVRDMDASLVREFVKQLTKKWLPLQPHLMG